MKKIKEEWLRRSLMLLIGVVMMGTAFTACSDDDDTGGGSSEEAIEAITGTWKGGNPRNPNASMTVNFYSDGTVRLWWTTNPLNATYYFEGTYTITKKNIHLKGMACTNGSSLASGWDVDESSSYSIKDGVLKFQFNYRQDWVLKAQ